LSRIAAGELDLVVLDNFSTLGEVEDENAASSFSTRIQQFLLQLKVQGVATILVHHAKKNSGENRKGGERTGNNFRGSSKLAATFETIIELERNPPASGLRRCGVPRAMGQGADGRTTANSAGNSGAVEPGVSRG
jgi:hypothetical protein